MGVGSGIYKLLLVLHILSAIVGFGGVMLNGVHGAQAKKRPPNEGAAIVDSTIAVEKVAQMAIYAVFVFGVLLMIASDETWKLSHLWLTASVALYLVGVGLSHGVMKKNVTRMRDLLAAGGGPELAEVGKRIGTVAPILSLIVVSILTLMVWKPL